MDTLNYKIRTRQSSLVGSTPETHQVHPVCYMTFMTSQHWLNVFGVTRVNDMGRVNTGSSTIEKEWWSKEWRKISELCILLNWVHIVDWIKKCAKSEAPRCLQRSTLSTYQVTKWPSVRGFSVTWDPWVDTCQSKCTVPPWTTPKTHQVHPMC